MQRPSGTLAVRLTLWALVFAALAMALVQPAQAGTKDAPEIQDPANDQVLFGNDMLPACNDPAPCATGSGIDVTSVWIDNETATQFDVHVITTSGSHASGLSPGMGVPDILVGADTFNVHFTIGADEYSATVLIDGTDGNAVTLSNAAHAATVVDTMLTVTILKSDIGSPAAGAQLTGFHVESSRAVDPIPGDAVSDVAPDDAEAAGVSYTFTGGSGGGGGTGTPGDVDGDGMNDTCEIKYFGNVTAQNASGDPDGDGLTNGQECAGGTDPTKADTDGDGTNDKDDPFPLDPTRGGRSNSTSSSSTSTSHSSSSSTSGSVSRTSTTGGAGGNDGKGAPKDLNEALDRLSSDPGYLGLSGGGFLAVLILCIIGLAVRWSL